jgi:hypothetical protein
MLRRAIITVSLLLAGTFVFAEASKRLVLKDGTYQAVREYEVKGDRVRYFSSERFEWEEMPNNLIDWPATKKYEEDLKKGVAHDAEQVDKERAEELAMEDAKTPTVAPNLKLPMQGGVFVLDNYNGTPQLIELSQATSDINRDTKGNILRAAINPLASNKQKVEVPGAHAKVQVHTTRPTVFFNVDEEGPVTAQGSDTGTPPKPEQRYRFVRMDQKKDVRQVGTVKISMTGKVSQQEVFLPTHGESIGGGWMKYTPEQDLAPGEYAVVEMLSDKEMNLYVWDLGINPSAPENPTAWKPEDVKPQAPQGPPTLNKRPPGN